MNELGGERIDIVPWHPDPEVFARRALAPARVSKVVTDSDRQVVTAIVDEDQLSLAIGRNGQNVRLASQLIGWQIDLYGSREWVERGSDLATLGEEGGDEHYETSDFPLSELDIRAGVLAALSEAGYDTFLQIIDLERRDFLGMKGLGEEDADRLLQIIDELTVVEGEAELTEDESDSEEGEPDSEEDEPDSEEDEDDSEENKDGDASGEDGESED